MSAARRFIGRSPPTAVYEPSPLSGLITSQLVCRGLFGVGDDNGVERGRGRLQFQPELIVKSSEKGWTARIGGCCIGTGGGAVRGPFDHKVVEASEPGLVDKRVGGGVLNLAE